MRTSVCTFFALLLSCFSLHAGISGQYCVSGIYFDGEPFCGKAEITKNNKVYEIHWEYTDGTTYTGIGVLKDNYIAFASVNDADAEEISVNLYKVKGNKLVDEFTAFGESVTGSETLKKSNCHSDECCEEN